MKRDDQVTLVRPFPISVDFRESQSEPGVSLSPYELRASLLKNLGIKASFLGVGVDRIDYTKGIIERFRGVERFLEKYPAYRRQVHLRANRRAQPHQHPALRRSGARSRGEVANRINARFQTSDWKPIVLLTRHHDHHEILPYYRAADFCMVTSLHDGMNLVAKEFVAAREDEGGALILSQFTGATRELRDAMIVNPYDAEQVAESIRAALEMDPDERRERMRRMRRIVRNTTSTAGRATSSPNSPKSVFASQSPWCPRRVLTEKHGVWASHDCLDGKPRRRHGGPVHPGNRFHRRGPASLSDDALRGSGTGQRSSLVAED